MKTVKIKEFKEDYSNQYLSSDYNRTSLEEWQRNNPGIKILDTRITQKVYTNYENYLLVTYEEEIKDEKQKS